MIRRVVPLVLLILAATNSQAAAASQDVATAVVRRLLNLQWQIARGDDGAAKAFAAARSQAIDVLKAEPVETWNQRVARSSLLMFVLIGGDRGVLRRLLDVKGLSERDGQFARGLVALGRGNATEAERLLGPLDLADADPLLQAAHALTLGRLRQSTDAAAATRHFAWVSLLAPGSLLEETALRRAVAAHAARNNAQEALETLGKWALRFPLSPFRQDFQQQMAIALQPLLGDGTITQRIRSLNRLRERDPNAWTTLMLDLVQTALKLGAIERARHLFEQIPAPDETADASRRNRHSLYAITIAAVDRGWSDARARAASLALDGLSSSDKALARLMLSLPPTTLRTAPDATAIAARPLRGEAELAEDMARLTKRSAAAHAVASKLLRSTSP